MNLGNFFAELKRRNVYRVAVAYAVVAWLLIQVATQVFPFFEIPSWGVRLIVLFIVIGFPVALVLAWAFELTPEGLKRTDDVAPEKSIANRTGRKLMALITVLAVLATGLLLYQFTRPQGEPAVATSAPAPAISQAAISEQSIAVLPFENLSAEKDDAFFADGIQDDVLTSLGKISELTVIARASVLSYRGEAVAGKLREIGQTLRVAHLLQGSVRRLANRVVVNVQLIDARNERQIWTERYDRTMADSLGLQGELATQIALALQARLAPEEKKSLETRPTDNPRAYALYLKALALGGRVNFSVENLIAEEQLFDQAIALDPKFALARAELSMSNTWLANETADERRRAKARSEAEEALRLSPSLGEAHLALGFCLFHGEKNYPAALSEFLIAAASLPNDPAVLRSIGRIYRRQGRWRESLASFERAQILDPLNRWSLLTAASSHMYVRDWPAATTCLHRLLEIAPDSVHAKIGLAYLEVFRAGNVAAAREILGQIPAGVDPDGHVTEARWDMCMLQRDFTGAEEILANFPGERFRPGEPWPKSFYQGQVALARGEAESAQRFFAAALPELETWIRDHPGAMAIEETLGLLHAVMGRKQEAIVHSRRAVELNPETQDAFHGAMTSANLALVYARTGEADQAIALIERLLATPGPVQLGFAESMTLAELRLRWQWDPLRNHPRFQKIVAGPEPKTVYH